MPWPSACGKKREAEVRTIRPSEAQPPGHESEISLNQKKRHGREINSRCVVTVVCAALQKVNLVVQYIKWIEIPPPEGKKHMENKITNGISTTLLTSP